MNVTLIELITPLGIFPIDFGAFIQNKVDLTTNDIDNLCIYLTNILEGNSIIVNGSPYTSSGSFLSNGMYLAIPDNVLKNSIIRISYRS